MPFPKELFETNLSEVRYIAIDTETTGAVPGKDHVVELAAVVFDEEFEQRRFETLIRPPVPIPDEVIRIHGITNDMVKDAPSFGEAMEAFAQFLKLAGRPRIFLAHNAAFDIGMIHGEAARSDLDIANAFEPELIVDSCRLARKLMPELRSHGLGYLAAHFGIESFQAHRAMGDATALKSIFLKFLGAVADQHPHKKGPTIESLINLTAGYFLFQPFQRGTAGTDFRPSPILKQIEQLCGSGKMIGIRYDMEDEYRYITPIKVRSKGWNLYIDAICHRDDIQKTFRADRVRSLGAIRAIGDEV